MLENILIAAIVVLAGVYVLRRFVAGNQGCSCGRGTEKTSCSRGCAERDA